MTQRGCTYAGCRGVVIGPIYDILHITHGPIGCGYYSWQTRRNLARPVEGQPNYLQYSMSTDMQEDHIVFGGEKTPGRSHPRSLRALQTESHLGLFHLPGRLDR